MPNTVKLSNADARAWRANKAQWVSPEGVVLRAVTPEEEKALFPLVERAKHMGKSSRSQVTAVYRYEDPDTGVISEQPVNMEAVFKVIQTGRQQTDRLLHVFVNGYRYVKGREIIEKRLLATHGECSIHGRNGKRLRVVRDPTAKRPTYAESQRSAPSPEHCHCRGWNGKGDPDRHHQACDWNGKAPPHERALPMTFVVEASVVDSPEPIASLAFEAPNAQRAAPISVGAPAIVRHRPVSSAAPPAPPGVQHNPMVAPVYANAPSPSMLAGGAITESVGPSAVEEVHAPEVCPNACLGGPDGGGWAWPAGRQPVEGHHHPLCQYEKAWARSKGPAEVFWLLDMETNIEVREATTEEVARAEIEFSRSGTRSLMISERIYAVVTRGGDVLTRRVPRHAPVPTLAMAPPVLEELRPAPPPAADPHEARRQQLIADGRLPFIPNGPLPAAAATAAGPQDELARLRARIAILEGRGQGVSNGVMQNAATEPARSQPGVIMGAAEHLRDSRGLIGDQQAGDDIAPGPVKLSEPEPFVDPLKAAQSSRPVTQPPRARPSSGPPPRRRPAPSPPGAPGSENSSHNISPSGEINAAAVAVIAAITTTSESAPSDLNTQNGAGAVTEVSSSPPA